MDERIVGYMPRTLSFAEAAAMPLTMLTAWQLLFDRMGIARENSAEKGCLLILAGAGGVGSQLTQLTRQLTGMIIVAIASREESGAWCRSRPLCD